MSGFAAPGDSTVVGVLLGGGEEVCVLWGIRGAALPVLACHRGELGGQGQKVGPAGRCSPLWNLGAVSRDLWREQGSWSGPDSPFTP